MTEENKIYYETILEERKNELEDIINKYDVRVVTLRPNNCRPKIYSEQSAKDNKNILDVWRAEGRIYIDNNAYGNYNEIFTLKLLNSNTDFNDSNYIYKILCKYFKKLVENKHGRMYRDDLIRKGRCE